MIELGRIDIVAEVPVLLLHMMLPLQGNFVAALYEM